jgi:AraC-like DNA-binding protein
MSQRVQGDVMPKTIKVSAQHNLSICELRNVIAALLPAGYPGLPAVAVQVGISPRTLQRRLSENDLTFTQLVNQARVTKACQRLAQQDVRIRKIARETGFATPSSFSRAFQSWTGTSPRDFRKGL